MSELKISKTDNSTEDYVDINGVRYYLEEGDNVLDNGSCLMFCTKDKNRMPFRDWNHCSQPIPQKEFIKFIRMFNVSKNYIRDKRTELLELNFYYWTYKIRSREKQ